MFGLQKRIERQETSIKRQLGTVQRLKAKGAPIDQIEKEEDRQDLVSAQDRLVSLADGIDQWQHQHLEGNVYWTEAKWRRTSPRVSLVAAPVDVGPALRSMLFEQVKTVVLTSATLSLNHEGNFDYFKSRVGLTSSNSVQLDSPFDYPRQAKVICVAGMPDPNSQKSKFEESCAYLNGHEQRVVKKNISELPEEIDDWRQNMEVQVAIDS